MNCPNCGSTLVDGTRFCPTCGAPIVGDTYVPDTAQMVRGDAPERSSVEVPAKEQAKENLRRARAAYVDARRAAGKSYAPRVIAGIVAAAVVAGAAGGGVWYVMDQRISEADARAIELQSQVDELQSQLEAASSAQQPTSGSTPEAGSPASSELELDDADAQSLVGTWTGSLSETSGADCCYGASETPLEVTIKNVDSTTGQMTIDVSVLFHGHGSLLGDAPSTDGDRVVAFEDLTSTYSEAGFTVRGDIEGTDDYVSITFTPERFSYGVRLAAEVESRHYEQSLGDSTTDTYSLEKS